MRAAPFCTLRRGSNSDPATLISYKFYFKDRVLMRPSFVYSSRKLNECSTYDDNFVSPSISVRSTRLAATNGPRTPGWRQLRIKIAHRPTDPEQNCTAFIATQSHYTCRCSHQKRRQRCQIIRLHPPQQGSSPSTLPPLPFIGAWFELSLTEQE